MNQFLENSGIDACRHTLTSSFFAVSTRRFLLRNSELGTCFVHCHTAGDYRLSFGRNGIVSADRLIVRPYWHASQYNLELNFERFSFADIRSAKLPPYGILMT